MAGRKHTAFTIITAVLLCFAVLGSFLFVALYSGHDCTHDDDCPVCRMIDAYIHTTRFFFVAAAAAVCAHLIAEITALLYRADASSRPITLILLKTELRN